MLPFKQWKWLLLLQPVCCLHSSQGQGSSEVSVVKEQGKDANEIIHRAAFTNNRISTVLFPKGGQVVFGALIQCRAKALQSTSVLQSNALTSVSVKTISSSVLVNSCNATRCLQALREVASCSEPQLCVLSFSLVGFHPPNGAAMSQISSSRLSAEESLLCCCSDPLSCCILLANSQLTAPSGTSNEQVRSPAPEAELLKSGIHFLHLWCSKSLQTF